jgi:hypothetical protein
MMYDDIANNTYNPIKGTIKNQIGGPNVKKKKNKKKKHQKLKIINFFFFYNKKKGLSRSLKRLCW